MQATSPAPGTCPALQRDASYQLPSAAVVQLSVHAGPPAAATVTVAEATGPLDAPVAVSVRWPGGVAFGTVTDAWKPAPPAPAFAEPAAAPSSANATRSPGSKPVASSTSSRPATASPPRAVTASGWRM